MWYESLTAGTVNSRHIKRFEFLHAIDKRRETRITIICIPETGQWKVWSKLYTNTSWREYLYCSSVRMPTLVRRYFNIVGYMDRYTNALSVAILLENVWSQGLKPSFLLWIKRLHRQTFLCITGCLAKKSVRFPSSFPKTELKKKKLNKTYLFSIQQRYYFYV